MHLVLLIICALATLFCAYLAWDAISNRVNIARRQLGKACDRNRRRIGLVGNSTSLDYMCDEDGVVRGVSFWHSKVEPPHPGAQKILAKFGLHERDISAAYRALDNDSLSKLHGSIRRISLVQTYPRHASFSVETTSGDCYMYVEERSWERSLFRRLQL